MFVSGSKDEQPNTKRNWIVMLAQKLDDNVETVKDFAILIN